MKGRSIDIAADVVADLATVAAGADIVAIDPGGKSSGMCWLRGSSVAWSMQGPPLEVVRGFRAVAGADVAVGVLARESPYVRVREDAAGEVQHARETAQMRALWKLGFAAGFVSCGIGRYVEGAALWEPMPSSWRSVLGLNRKKTAEHTAREETNTAVWQWAKATTRMDLVSARGARLYDESNAIALAFAARAVADAVKRM